MLETLNKYIEEQPSRGVTDRARAWLRDERVFARLLVISAILHVIFYASIILLNSWEMRRIKPLRQQGSTLELITEIAPPPSPSKLRTPTVALERADVRRFAYDPQNANDTDLIARAPNPSTQRGNKGAQPSASQVEAQISRTRGGASGSETRPSPVSVQPPVVASVPGASAPVPQPAASVAPSAANVPAPPAPRPSSNQAPDSSAGTQRGTGSESTAFGLQRISAQYIAAVRSKVYDYNKAYMPHDFVDTTLSGTVAAEFSLVIDRNGRIVRLTLLRPSGYRALDATARQAIVNASPFEGYPQSAGDTITLTVTVYYQPSR